MNTVVELENRLKVLRYFFDKINLINYLEMKQNVLFHLFQVRTFNLKMSDRTEMVLHGMCYKTYEIKQRNLFIDPQYSNEIDVSNDGAMSFSSIWSESI
jgi:ABC-type lipoprotein export system ATPase subunit